MRQPLRLDVSHQHPPAEPAASSAPAPGGCGAAAPAAPASHRRPGAGPGLPAAAPPSPRRLASSAAQPPPWLPVPGRCPAPAPAALPAAAGPRWRCAAGTPPAPASPSPAGAHSLQEESPRSQLRRLCRPKDGPPSPVVGGLFAPQNLAGPSFTHTQGIWGPGAPQPHRQAAESLHLPHSSPSFGSGRVKAARRESTRLWEGDAILPM